MRYRTLSAFRYIQSLTASRLSSTRGLTGASSTMRACFLPGRSFHSNGLPISASMRCLSFWSCSNALIFHGGSMKLAPYAPPLRCQCKVDPEIAATQTKCRPRTISGRLQTERRVLRLDVRVNRRPHRSSPNCGRSISAGVSVPTCRFATVFGRQTTFNWGAGCDSPIRITSISGQVELK